MTYHETTHDSDDDTSSSDDQTFNSVQSLSDSSEDELLQSPKKCFIRVQRTDFIESAVEKGFKSVLIEHHGQNSSQLRYTPIP